MFWLEGVEVERVGELDQCPGKIATPYRHDNRIRTPASKKFILQQLEEGKAGPWALETMRGTH